MAHDAHVATECWRRGKPSRFRPHEGRGASDQDVTHALTPAGSPFCRPRPMTCSDPSRTCRTCRTCRTWVAYPSWAPDWIRAEYDRHGRVVLDDVTTLHFEARDEDSSRKTGVSTCAARRHPAHPR